MSQHITPEKLEAFALAVTKAAHDHLGSNGVISVAVGLERDSYYSTQMEAMRSPYALYSDDLTRTVIDTRYFLSFFNDFVAVTCAEEWGEFTKYLKARAR